MKAIIRGFITPEDLLKKVQKVSKRVGSNPNQAHNEGLMLWLKREEDKVKRRDRRGKKT